MVGPTMELKLISKDDKSIRVEVIGESDTLLYPLQQKLLSMKEVTYASYSAKHPKIDNLELLVRVKKGDPESILVNAANSIANEYKKCLKLFDQRVADLKQ
jgi:DNA-directed RNA polymerase subunit L